ncbi:MAG TPA: L-fucose/L-arabinose isomerase family protein [Rectinemataceae bacterium]|nr:L-fucose/L-arabinose isomerase family protein [Rectinemataceae bacterium]
MIVERRRPLYARVGVLGVGHHTYWEQFEGLREVMVQKTEAFKLKLEGCAVEIVDFGLIDDSRAAYRVLEEIRKADLDLLFIDMVTYATSATFAPLVQALNIPIVLVVLQPLRAMEYARGTTFMQLCNDDFCSVPEFCSVAVRMGKKTPPLVIGLREGDEEADEEIRSWCRIAHVLHDLKNARIGLMGHVLECMYDMHVDPTLMTRTFGCHVVQVEPEDIFKHYTRLGGADLAAMRTRILSFFDRPAPVSDILTSTLAETDLAVASKAAVALEMAINELDLTGLAYYYEGEEGSELRTMVTNFIVGNSLLTAAGFPMCGEFDLKTCVAMLIMDRLEIGGSFAEFHPLDFNTGSILVGHDGPHHLNIADRKPVLRSLSKYHGKPGSGAGVEFKIKEGPLTMLSVTVNAEGGLKFVIAEGESLQGAIPPTGNTNTHGYFKPDLKTFLKRWTAEGPTHHFALGIGHHGDELVKVAEALGIDYARISIE